MKSEEMKYPKNSELAKVWYEKGRADMIKEIDEVLKNKHNFNSFCIKITSKQKSLDKEGRDKIRQTINPKVRAKANGKCSFCNRDVFEVGNEVGGGNTIHHIIPERYSGSYEEENLLVVCARCHVKVENCIRAVEKEAIKHTLLYFKKDLEAKG
jgi:5-methylcytosine-specific restriction endonuclease McrA